MFNYTLDGAETAGVIIIAFFALATITAFAVAAFDGWADNWREGNVFDYLPY